MLERVETALVARKHRAGILTKPMNPEIIAKLIEQIEAVRSRPAMWMGRATLQAVQGFGGGIHCIWGAFGVDPKEFHPQATINRGWPYTSIGGINRMKSDGLTEAQIVDELLLIEIEMLRLHAKTLRKSSADV